ALLFLASAMGASVNAASGRAVMQWFSVEERGLALGIRQTAIPLGAAVGALTLPLVEHAGGLKAAFTYLGALSGGGAIAAGLFFHDVYCVSDARAAVVLAVFQVGAVFSRIGAGRLSDRLRSRLRPLRWIGLASAGGLLLT